MEFFSTAVVFAGLVTCGGQVDYCPSSAVGKLGVDVTVVEAGRFSIAATATHYSDALDNEWLEPFDGWFNVGDRGTEFYGVEARWKLW